MVQATCLAQRGGEREHCHQARSWCRLGAALGGRSGVVICASGKRFERAYGEIVEVLPRDGLTTRSTKVVFADGRPAVVPASVARFEELAAALQTAAAASDRGRATVHIGGTGGAGQPVGVAGVPASRILGGQVDAESRLALRLMGLVVVPLAGLTMCVIPAIMTENWRSIGTQTPIIIGLSIWFVIASRRGPGGFRVAREGQTRLHQIEWLLDGDRAIR